MKKAAATKEAPKGTAQPKTPTTPTTKAALVQSQTHAPQKEQSPAAAPSKQTVEKSPEPQGRVGEV